ncbi:MAG: hypothetical protein ACFCUE_11995 [Candidatus Bathyarchaeia archaeon]|jgi:hypothetical protein
MAKKGKVKFTVKLQEASLNKIKSLKKHYGTQDNAELIIILVNEKAQQLNTCPKEA